MEPTHEFVTPEDRHLGRILQLQAERNADTRFLVTDDVEFTFAEAEIQTNKIARGIAKLGVNRGDRVCIYMAGCIEYPLLALAINKLGAVWVPVNTDYKGSWLLDNIRESQASLIVTSDEYLPKLADILPDLDCKQVLLNGANDPQQLCANKLSDFDSEDGSFIDLGTMDYGDTSAILWTSGTTGKPKGVMQPHNAWVRAAESSNNQSNDGSKEICYNVLPMYNSAAWTTSIFPALVGGFTCTMDPAFSVTTFWDRIKHFGATRTFTLGSMHMFLWNQPEKDDDADNPLRIAGMVPMPDEIVEPFKKRFGLDEITQGYGQSESQSMMSRSSKQDWPANALGQPVEGQQIKLLDDQGNEVPVGESGEFCILPERDYILFSGYFNNPEATAKAYHGDWYRTGDLGRQDEDGNFYFVDRKSDFIRYKGRNISSLQVEGIARQHPAVAEAAVIGITSQELKSEAEIKLDIVLKPDHAINEDELARFINDNAPYFMVPRYIEFRDALPYTPTNKVQKYKLRELGVGDNTWDQKAAGFKVER